MRIVRDVDEKVWRAFVEENASANIFHTPEMMQVFARAEGYQPQVWAALRDDGELLALWLPVQHTVLDQPLLRQLSTRAVLYGSVLCASGPQGQEALNQLLSIYNRETKSQVIFTELRNLTDMGDLQPVLTQNGFAYEEHLNFLIDLTQSEQAMWKAIRSNAQRNVRKARKSGVVIEETQGQSGVTAAYAILQQVYKRVQVPLPHVSLFRAVFELLWPQDMAKIFLARADGETIGVLTLLIYKGVAIYWYTGALREFSSYRANDMMVWHALEWSQKHGCHTFDFGGAGKPDEEYGVRDFKAKFGGSLVNYGRNVCVHAPLRRRASETGYELLRRFL
jgi:hypothetical protein